MVVCIQSICPALFTVPSTFFGTTDFGNLWRRTWCFLANDRFMNVPPAPESKRTGVSTVLFPLFVLYLIGIEIVIDCFSISATSTEEIVISESDVNTGHFFKNLHQ